MSETMEITEQQDVSFAEIRQILKDLAEQQKEASREFDRRLKEKAREFDRDLKKYACEFDRDLKKNAREFDRQTKDYNKRFGDFTNRFGEVIEYMIVPNLFKKFRKHGLHFNEGTRNKYVCDEKHDISFEIDVLLENTDKAMLVEIKTHLTMGKIKTHIKRLEKMRAYADLHGDKRIFLGAVAGVIMTVETKKYALDQGFYVIEPSGETFNITPPDKKPKEW